MTLQTDAVVIAELAAHRGRLRRAARHSADLLADAQHALANGRYEVVAEYLDRAVTQLREAAR